MKQLSVHDVAKQLSALLAAGEPIEITRYNRPVATLTPYPTVAPTASASAHGQLGSAPPGGWAQAGRDALLRTPKG